MRERLTKGGWVLGVVLLAVGAGGAWLADLVGIPAGAMIGALAASSIYHLAGGRVGPWRGRYGRAGRLLLGAVIGGAFGPDVIEPLKLAILPVLASITFIVCLGLLLGWGLSRVTHLDARTALLSVMPGGLPAMVGMSDELDADVTVVAGVHFARLSAILLITPLIMPLLAATQGGATAPAASGDPAQSVGIWLTLATLACGVAGGVAGCAARIPSGDLMGSMVAVSVANLFGAGLGPLAAEYRVASMVLIGISVGTQVSMESLRRLRDIALPAAACIALLIVAGLLMGWCLWLITPLDLPTALLSAVPGGAGTMPAIAHDLGGDMRLVAALHLARQLVLVLILLPVLTRAVAFSRRRPARAFSSGE
jgi:uncharacterized protein